MRIIDLRRDGEIIIMGEITSIEPIAGEFSANISLDTGYMVCIDADEIARIAKKGTKKS